MEEEKKVPGNSVKKENDEQRKLKNVKLEAGK